ncbi:phage major capsid protein [Devosia sp. RR2S18]|uniref:phage major capsid protein n=1 Tax=Devosia rhizosphaerae TaxID=3049774 RepID=UPI0025423B9F|nr:phage major capsid protein [Devosia sp. RR2S18]WIJ24235.1 phage major capsid protein [Devosia sp. RR2S18]
MEKLEVKAEVSIDDAGTLSGIAWPFGLPDSVGDVIEKGAFSFPDALPIILEHDQNKVVGVWETAEQTDAGLEVKGRLFIEGVKPSRDAHALMKARRINGLSIGFKADAFDPLPTGGRKFSAVTVTEISLCRRPVHPGARITSVKSMEQEHTHMENETTEEVALELKAANDNITKLTARLDKMEAKANRPTAANDNSPAAANDNERKAFADFVRSGDSTEVKSLGYAAPSSGGILAPEQVATSILEKVAEFSPVRGLAQTISMSGPLLQLPRLVDEVEPVSVTETAARTEDEPTFDQIDLKPFEMAVIVPVTRILLEDAQIDLTSYLGNHVARRFGQKEASWFVTGNGTTQAEGVLTSADVADFEVAGITGDDLIDLFYSVKTAYSANGAWLMNRQTMATVRKLKDTDGSYLWERGIAAGQPPLLLGRPVYEAVDMPNAAAGTTPIVFGDFATGYAIADRTGFEIIRDDLTGAGNGIVKLHARRRVGGRVVMGEALTKLKIAA